MTASALFQQFGTYILPGRINDPRRGHCPKRKRLSASDLALSGFQSDLRSRNLPCWLALSARATKRIRINATMYATMRHPLVTASVANMMQAMSGDRFRHHFRAGRARDDAKCSVHPL